jgi:hypothetical protein
METGRRGKIMKLCGTCKFWGNDEDATEQFRWCRAVVHDQENYADPDDDEWCGADELAEKIAFRKTHKAIVLDGSGFKAALRCREDFGCVLHKEKS